MPTLRRILKYTQAVVLLLVPGLWIASLFAVPYVALGHYSFETGRSRVIVRYNETANPHRLKGGAYWQRFNLDRLEDLLGEFLFAELFTGGWRLDVPIPLLLMAVLPFGFLPFFRFRLWHYLAYTALVAVELAYYLRWQE